MKARHKNTIRSSGRLYVLLMAAGLSALLALGPAGCSRDADDSSANQHEEGAVYACPMLCVPPTDKPGKCPVCGMELERVDGASADEMGKPEINMSERSRLLSKVETALVERKDAAAEIRLTGRVMADETRMFHIAARVPGRIDGVAADYTGKELKKGDPIVTLYSPQLLSAQEELIQASGSGDKANLEAVREKLKLLGITEEKIAEIEKSGKATEQVTFVSPIDGTVTHKEAVQGAYVKEGSRLYSIADLTKVWVLLDAYEKDLPYLRSGQDVTFSPEAVPGKELSAKISFIQPVLDEKTRALPVRLEVDNPEGLLKPGMLVRATVHLSLGADGAPLEPGAEGSNMPLVIPASAPLITGKRAVVYLANSDDGTYEGRNVVLGPRAGEQYVVLEGLAEGDRVVVRGNFRIDSALQIMGKPSMMTPADKPDTTPPPRRSPGQPQTKCPIMGGEINRDVYIDHNGYRVYFCCPGCDTAFKKDADAIIKKMLDDGIVVERSPEGK